MPPSFSEDSFLSQLFPQLKSNEQIVIGPGDDCAVYQVPNSELLQVIAVDQVIANRHFLPETSAYDAGRKLLARNLSDIAAMGATPTYALISAAIAPDKDEQWLKDFHQGIIELANKHSVLIIGGDLAQSDKGDTVASLTILGQTKKEELCARHGVKAGDLLCVTGELGNSFLSEHHLYFEPRLEIGRWLGKHQIPNAMMDISDGLLKDVQRMIKGQTLRLILDLKKLPLRQGATIKSALTEGEDYELLFTVSKEKYDWLEKNWDFKDSALHIIGKFELSDQMEIQDQEARNLLELNTGFDHFEDKK